MTVEALNYAKEHDGRQGILVIGGVPERGIFKIMDWILQIHNKKRWGALKYGSFGLFQIISSNVMTMEEYKRGSI